MFLPLVRAHPAHVSATIDGLLAVAFGLVEIVRNRNSVLTKILRLEQGLARLYGWGGSISAVWQTGAVTAACTVC